MDVSLFSLFIVFVLVYVVPICLFIWAVKKFTDRKK